MKTTLRDIILFTFACIILINGAVAQSNVKSKNFSYYGDLPDNNKLIRKVNDNLFLLYTHPEKNRSSLVGFDSNLQELFKIETAATRPTLIYSSHIAEPSFAYIEEVNQILMIESLQAGTNTEFQFKLLDTAGNILKADKFSLEGKLFSVDKIDITNDGKYFAIYQNVGKKFRDLKVTLYAASTLQQMYSKVFPVKEKEVFKASTLSSSGNFILVSDIAENEIEVKRYDQKGLIEHTFKFEKNISGKEEFGNYLLKAVGQRVVLATTKSFSSNLMEVGIYDMDFQNKKAKKFRSIEFNAENVAKIYENVNEEQIINTNNSLISSAYKKPKHLEDFQLQHLLIEDDNIIVISESKTSKEHISGRMQYMVYNAGDILVSTFTEGKNSWNNIIGRQLTMPDALGGWDALTSSVFLEKGNLQLLTSEYMRGDNKNLMLYLRNVDLTTGAVSAPKRLVDHYFWYNTGFVDWLKPNSLILYRTAGMNFLKRDGTLNLVELDKFPAQ